MKKVLRVIIIVAAGILIQLPMAVLGASCMTLTHIWRRLLDEEKAENFMGCIRKDLEELIED